MSVSPVVGPVAQKRRPWRLLVGVVAAAALIVGLQVGTPSQAQAGVPCKAAHICGSVHNIGSTNIGIVKNWVSPIHWDFALKPGQYTNGSPWYWYDADGFYNGSGICAQNYVLYQGYWQAVGSPYGPGYHKINDLTHLNLRAGASYC